MSATKSTDWVLRLLKRTEALLEGHFLLSSGLHSDRYFQCARLLQHPRRAARVGRAIADLCRPFGAQLVVSPALGGVVIGHEVGRALGVRAIFTEREQGIMRLRRGFEIARRRAGARRGRRGHHRQVHAGGRSRRHRGRRGGGRPGLDRRPQRRRGLPLPVPFVAAAPSGDVRARGLPALPRGQAAGGQTRQPPDGTLRHPGKRACLNALCRGTGDRFRSPSAGSPARRC